MNSVLNENVFKEYCSKLKLIVSEVDGIMTEDLSFLTEVGFTAFKAFYRKDFEAVNELKNPALAVNELAYISLAVRKLTSNFPLTLTLL